MDDGPGEQEGHRDVVLIDSLFIMDQFKAAAERMGAGKPHTKDIAEVTAVAEGILPKGSARISTTVSAWREGRELPAPTERLPGCICYRKSEL